ncbi:MULTISPECIES: hypothetical protein [Cupriavidus]|nr:MULTISPECIES: hypothetical protein [Cupriavidus]MDF3880971.1 hypothetical protein [Cupriavidus basilensis]
MADMNVAGRLRLQAIARANAAYDVRQAVHGKLYEQRTFMLSATMDL